MKNIKTRNYNSVDKLIKNTSVLSLTDKIIPSYGVKQKDEAKEELIKFGNEVFEEDEKKILKI